MNYSEIFEKYNKLIANLLKIINDSQERVINENPDNFFTENYNFLAKSYLVSLCSYLEAYLKEAANAHVTKIQGQLKEINLPHNIIYWRIHPDVKEKDLKFQEFSIPITTKDIDDELSSNPFKTSRLFRYIGINLEDDETFKAHKEQVNSVVAKRNSIIHHNDSAADITLIDINTYITIFTSYMKSIDLKLSSYGLKRFNQNK